ncbi:hypothetical protein EUGRSUZ_F04487 [Eucalyptus grandis]|uniref:Uncharacterized protein n=2 Tax=Eucalyptus grandis TaxID=71139 RepID=A0ACC3KPZ7_EUCGR|nr:hypothetical protein EUGRSUZ_F04487 [Eucalyptus grandis]
MGNFRDGMGVPSPAILFYETCHYSFYAVITQNHKKGQALLLLLLLLLLVRRGCEKFVQEGPISSTAAGTGASGSSGEPQHLLHITKGGGGDLWAQQLREVHGALHVVIVAQEGL